MYYNNELRQIHSSRWWDKLSIYFIVITVTKYGTMGDDENGRRSNYNGAVDRMTAVHYLEIGGESCSQSR